MRPHALSLSLNTGILTMCVINGLGVTAIPIDIEMVSQCPVVLNGNQIRPCGPQYPIHNPIPIPPPPPPQWQAADLMNDGPPVPPRPTKFKLGETTTQKKPAPPPPNPFKAVYLRGKPFDTSFEMRE